MGVINVRGLVRSSQTPSNFFPHRILFLQQFSEGPETLSKRYLQDLDCFCSDSSPSCSGITEEMRTRSGWCHQVLNVPAGSDTSHLCSHSIGQNQSCDDRPPPQVQRKTWGSAQVQWTVAWQDRAHETSPGGTQEAVKNVSWRRAGGGHRTTETWETGHEGGGEAMGVNTVCQGACPE